MEVVDCDAQCFSVRFSGGIFARDASVTVSAGSLGLNPRLGTGTRQR